MAKHPDKPFSHSIRIDDIPPAGLTLAIEADEAERKDAALLADALSVERLRAELTVTREGDRVRVLGTVKAAVVQACVVTLEPVRDEIDCDVEVVFAPREEAEALLRKAGLGSFDDVDADDIDLPDIDLAAIDLDMLNDPDALPEPIEDGAVDLGHIAFDTLLVEMDPYPRKEGVAFEPPEEPEDFGKPFAALKALKPKQ